MSKIGGFFLIISLLFAACAAGPTPSLNDLPSEGTGAETGGGVSGGVSAGGNVTLTKKDAVVSEIKLIEEKVDNFIIGKLPKFKEGTFGHYAVSNWIYFLIIILTLIVTTIICLKARKKRKKSAVLIPLSIGAGIIIATLSAGFFVTNDLGKINTPHLPSLPGISKTTSTNKQATVNVATLNLRSDASPTSKVLAVLTKNVQVQVLDDSRKDDWIKVNYKNVEGYVNKRYLK